MARAADVAPADERTGLRCHSTNVQSMAFFSTAG